MVTRANERVQMVTKNILKSILHNIIVLIVGFIFAFIGTRLDQFFGISKIKLEFAIFLGLIFLTAGFLLRLWATYYFYQNQIKVISLKPQEKLITSGPFGLTRNPLYLGGNVFIFLGASLFLGSPMGILLTILHLPLIDLFIRREEKQLEKTFGREWITYKGKVGRWI